MGTLGSGNHYLEVQQVVEVCDADVAAAFGVHMGDILVSIHCGSRGLGHQIGTEFLKQMVIAATSYGIDLPDRELACAPINSAVGQAYLGAMRAGINCALANRQIITHLVRQAFAEVPPRPAYPCCTMCPTTPAKSKSTASTVCPNGSSCTAKGRRAPLDLATLTCRWRCGPSANRC